MDVLRRFDPLVRAALERAYRRRYLAALGLSLLLVAGASRVMEALRGLDAASPLRDRSVEMLPYVELVELDEPEGGSAGGGTPGPPPPIVPPPEEITAVTPVAPTPAIPVPVAQPPPAPPTPRPPSPVAGTSVGTGSGGTGVGTGGTGAGEGTGDGDGTGDGAGDPGPPPLVASPERPPRGVRLRFPVYPEAARREGVRARVRVEVLVDEHGQPQQPRIVERVLLRRGNREQAVPSLPYGMEEAALDAARGYSWQSPAQHGGRRVRTYVTLTLQIGT